MKKITFIITTCLLLATVSIIRAQTIGDLRKMPAEQKAKLISDSLKTNLNLTGKQYDKVYTEALAAIKKMAPVFKEDISKMEKRKQMQAVLIDEQAKLKAILTPAQYELLQTLKQKLAAYYMRLLQDQKLVFNAPQ